MCHLDLQRVGDSKHAFRKGARQRADALRCFVDAAGVWTSTTAGPKPLLARALRMAPSATSKISVEAHDGSRFRLERHAMGQEAPKTKTRSVDSWPSRTALDRLHATTIVLGDWAHVPGFLFPHVPSLQNAFSLPFVPLEGLQRPAPRGVVAPASPSHDDAP